MMRSLLRHRDNKYLKILVPVGGMLSIFGAFVLLNTPLLFTYTSHANEDSVHGIQSQQDSIQTVRIKNDLPSCVSSLNFIPTKDKSLQTCFVQFVCTGVDSSMFFTAPHYSCSKVDSANICSENTTIDSCGYVDEWIKGAATTCGC